MFSPGTLKEILKPSNSVLVVWDVHRALFNGIFNKDEFQRALSTAINAARRINVPIIFTKITPFPSGFEPATVRIAVSPEAVICFHRLLLDGLPEPPHRSGSRPVARGSSPYGSRKPRGTVKVLGLGL